MRRSLFRHVCSAALATVCLALPAPKAEAGDQWCEDDPLVVVQTPKGNLVPLFVTNGARGIEHFLAVQLADIRYTAKSTGYETAVTMSVTIPAGLPAARFETRSTVSTGPFKTGIVYATTNGYSQEAMTLKFKLDVP